MSAGAVSSPVSGPEGSKRMFIRARKPTAAARRAEARSPPNSCVRVGARAASFHAASALRRRRAGERGAHILTSRAATARRSRVDQRVAVGQVDVGPDRACWRPPRAWRRGSSAQPRRVRVEARPRALARGSRAARPGRRAGWRARAAGARRTPSGGRACRRRSPLGCAPKRRSRRCRRSYSTPGGAVGAGVRYQVAPSNRSARACSTPAVLGARERMAADEALVAPRLGEHALGRADVADHAVASGGVERRAHGLRERPHRRRHEHHVARPPPPRRCPAPARRSRRAPARARARAGRGHTRTPARRRARARPGRSSRRSARRRGPRLQRGPQRRGPRRDLATGVRRPSTPLQGVGGRPSHGAERLARERRGALDRDGVLGEVLGAQRLRPVADAPRRGWGAPRR